MSDQPVSPLRQRAEQIARQLHTTGKPASESSSADIIERELQAVHAEATRADRERVRAIVQQWRADDRVYVSEEVDAAFHQCADELEALAASDPGEGTSHE